MSELVLERPRALPHDTFWSAEGEEGMAKILVIEDDTEIRELLAEILTESGHEVLIAADGALGLALCEPHRPTLIITDLQVSGLSGLEVIARLRAEPGVKIIAISGSGAANLEAAERLGAVRTFQKPFSIDDLVAVVGELVGPARSAQHVQLRNPHRLPVGPVTPSADGQIRGAHGCAEAPGARRAGGRERGAPLF